MRPLNQQELIAQEADRLRKEQELKDLMELLNNEMFLRFFISLFFRCRFFLRNFTGNSQGMQYEGMRTVALDYLDDLNALGPDALDAFYAAHKQFVADQLRRNKAAEKRVKEAMKNEVR